MGRKGILQWYRSKYDEVNSQEKSVNIGLQKLKEASQFVDKLKVDIQEQQVAGVMRFPDAHPEIKYVEEM